MIVTGHRIIMHMDAFARLKAESIFDLVTLTLGTAP